ncbi:MAG: membrane-associated phospholipid phosphatase [Patiriisocius sp.]|jgi:membrane-associated phospholipid phosphatase
MNVIKHSIFSVFFLSLLCPSTTSAQSSREIKEPTLWQDFTYDMGTVLGGIGYAYTRPLHWQKSDFINLGGVVLGTSLLYTIDDNVREEFRDHGDDIPQFIHDYGWYAGSPQNNYGLQGLVYATGLFTKNEKLRRTGVLLIASATATGIVQQIAKSAVGRARPGGELGKNHFKPFGGTARYRSFPSGHAVLTFTNAHVIAKQFKNKWIKAGIYTVGLVPGLSRIYADAHWASDVFLSWVMSYFMVEAIDRYLNKKYDKKYNDQQDGSTSINLTFTGNTVGFMYQF